MKLRKIGGIAALACAGTYIFGFVLLVTLLSQMGFGSNDIDAAAIVTYSQKNPGVMITWNTVIYVVNSLALTVLVVALWARIKEHSAEWATITLGFGLIWATLVLAAGMIANVAIERVVSLASDDFESAVEVWKVLHAVELGLGGGNEIAGGIWILCVSLAGMMHRVLGKVIVGLGLLTGLGGFLTILPPLGDTAGAVFGLGAIAWFIAVGISLAFGKASPANTTQRAVAG